MNNSSYLAIFPITSSASCRLIPRFWSAFGRDKRTHTIVITTYLLAMRRCLVIEQYYCGQHEYTSRPYPVGIIQAPHMVPPQGMKSSVRGWGVEVEPVPLSRKTFDGRSFPIGYFFNSKVNSNGGTQELQNIVRHRLQVQRVSGKGRPGHV